MEVAEISSRDHCISEVSLKNAMYPQSIIFYIFQAFLLCKILPIETLIKKKSIKTSNLHLFKSEQYSCFDIQLNYQFASLKRCNLSLLTCSAHF